MKLLSGNPDGFAFGLLIPEDNGKVQQINYLLH